MTDIIQFQESEYDVILRQAVAVIDKTRAIVILYYTHSIRGFNKFYKFIKRNNRKFRKETIID